MTTMQISVNCQFTPYTVFLVADEIRAVKTNTKECDRMLKAIPHLWVGTYCNAPASAIDRDIEHFYAAMAA